MRVVIEDFDNDIHGDHDDCDYVISFDHFEKNAKSMAEQMGEMMGYETHQCYAADNNTSRIYCCHA